MNFTVADIDISIDIDEVLDLPPTDILKILELLGLGCLLSLILWLALSRRRRNRPPRPLPLLITVIARRYFWEYELWQVNGNSMSKKTVISRGQRMGRVNHMWVDHMLVIPEDRSVKFTVISPQGVYAAGRCQVLVLITWHLLIGSLKNGRSLESKVLLLGYLTRSQHTQTRLTKVSPCLS